MERVRSLLDREHPGAALEARRAASLGHVQVMAGAVKEHLPRVGRQALRSGTGYSPYERHGLEVKTTPFHLPPKALTQIPSLPQTPRNDTWRQHWNSSYLGEEVMPILADNILPAAYRRPPTSSQTSRVYPFPVVVGESERRAAHEATPRTLTPHGTVFELVPAPMSKRSTLSGQSNWLNGRLESTPRPAHEPPLPKAPGAQQLVRQARPLHTSPSGLLSLRDGQHRRSRERLGVLYKPPNSAYAHLTPMREHASASGFSSEPFAGLC